uniref:ANK_REP_REGION domain-containing protein n=1 Tax=Anisakis simplex TaxID=6269 RepID=A0A0M3JD17_ANISI
LKAVVYDNDELLRDLLQTSSNPNKVHYKDTYGRSALHIAAQHGNTTTIDLLIEAGVDDGLGGVCNILNAQIPFILWRLFMGLASAKRLISADVNCMAGASALCMTPLHVAASSGQVSAVKRLIEHGADLLATDLSEHCALELAQMTNQFETACLLIDAIGSSLYSAVTRYFIIVSSF